MYFRFIKVNFPFTNGEGERQKLSFPSTVISVYGGFLSTVDNFRDTFRSPQYSFTASYDAKNELKKRAKELRQAECEHLPEVQPHFTIYVTKNYVSLFLYLKKAYKNERGNKFTKLA